jgi:hypothetical protein
MRVRHESSFHPQYAYHSFRSLSRVRCQQEGGTREKRESEVRDVHVLHAHTTACNKHRGPSERVLTQKQKGKTTARCKLIPL